MTNENTSDDAAVVIRPELLTFSPIKIDGQHVLRILIHTGNLGTFLLPVAPAQARELSKTLLDYVGQVAEYEAQRV